MSDYLAAKEEDLLEHTSWVADLVSGLCKGAIYAAIGIGAALLIGATGGAAIAVGIAAGATFGFVLGDIITELTDGIGNMVDSALDFFGLKGPPDGIITSGSPNTKTKSKRSARAAGKIPNIVLRAEIAHEKENPPDPKPLSLLKNALGKAAMLAKLTHPVGWMMMAKDALNPPENKAEPLPEGWPEKVPSPKQGFFAGIFSPIVAQKNPYASEMPEDTIACQKYHPFADSVLYLAEGSKKVLINSQPASRNGDRSTCEAVIKHTQEKSRIRIGGATAVVRDIMSGKNPVAHFLGEVVGSLLTAQALTNGLTRNCLKDLPCMLLTDAIFSGLGAVGGGAIGAFFSKHPIHLSTGAKVLADQDELDFTLSGDEPLIWQRIYNSRNLNTGILGKGWNLPFEVSLRIAPSKDLEKADDIIYTDMSGRDLNLGAIALGHSVYFKDEGFRLYRTTNNIYLLETNEADYQLFEANPLKQNHLRLYETYDRHQNSLHYHYDQRGRLIAIHNDNKTIDVSLNYLPDTSLLQSVFQHAEDQKRLLVSYEYNAFGQLIAVFNADEHLTRRFEYADINKIGHDLMIMHQYATGLQSHYRWQKFKTTLPSPLGTDIQEHWYVCEHWLWDQTSHLRLEESFLEYEPDKCQLKMTETGVGTSFRKWNHQFMVAEYTNILGDTWQFSWNDAQLVEVINPQAGKHNFQYDNRGNLFSSQNPLGETTLTEWHSVFAFPLKVTDHNGNQWHYRYNDYADVIEIQSPDQNSTQYRYDEFGNTILIIDPKGNQTQYYYNDRGQLSRYIDCSNKNTYIYYDDFGTLSRITDAEGQRIEYQFSPAKLLLSHTNALGKSKKFTYNKSGLLSELTDFNNKKTHFHYNIRGQVIQQINPKNAPLSYQYDRFGNLITLINQKNEPYRFKYDALNRLIEQQDLIGKKKTFAYDSLNQLIQLNEIASISAKKTLPATMITHFEYDVLGRPIVKKNSDTRTEFHYKKYALNIKRFSNTEFINAQIKGETPLLQDELSFKYDLSGHLIEEKNQCGTYKHQYDALGNILETQLHNGQYLRHLYYGSGHLLQTNLETGGDLLGEIAPESRHIIAEYERDHLHREIARSQGKLQLKTEYDALGRISQRKTHMAGLSDFCTPLIDKRYGYDHANNLVSRIVQHGQQDASFQMASVQYEEQTYDELGHITQVIKDHFNQETFI